MSFTNDGNIHRWPVKLVFTTKNWLLLPLLQHFMLKSANYSVNSKVGCYIDTYIHKLYFSSNLKAASIKANFSEKTITKITKDTTTY